MALRVDLAKGGGVKLCRDFQHEDLLDLGHDHTSGRLLEVKRALYDFLLVRIDDGLLFEELADLCFAEGFARFLAQALVEDGGDREADRERQYEEDVDEPGRVGADVERMTREGCLR